MGDRFLIAIVGAGPAGLSAAARAAELGIRHVLLEASANIADTVRRFQKGKLVMAEPAQLPLRSTLSFAAGTRESILDTWQGELAKLGVNLQTGKTVSSIAGHRDDFTITLASGERVAADHVVLAIGLQGNILRLDVPGAELPGVQYHLHDSEDYVDETILIIGGGDSGVENALALAKRNRVILINRQDEFTSCREANFARLREASAAGKIETRTGTSVVRIDRGTDSSPTLTVLLQSPRGSERIHCNRIIARIGALPPRRVLEGFGIRFPSSDASATPTLSDRYESSVPGLHVIGTLAGYPLIKQSLNQGYEVIEHILGHSPEPADHAFLLEKFVRIPGLTSVTDGIRLLRRTQPLLASLTDLQLREFMLDSNVLTPRRDEIIFKRGDYSNSFFSVLQGSVRIHVDMPDDSTASFDLQEGEFFGEIGLLSGRRRSGTVVAGADCAVIETPRRSMLRLLDSAPGVQRRLDEVSLKRVVRNCYGGSLTEDELDHLVQEARWKKFALGEVVFSEGDPADALYMIRRGSVTVSRQVAGKEVVSAYVSAGNYVGEMALVSNTPRTATVRAAAPTEMVLLDAERFNAVLDRNTAARGEIAARYLERVRANESSTARDNSEFVQFLMDQGIGEATDVLLIDYAKCIHCNNCETACADVHDGASRLRRDAGQTHGMIHVPGSCRHCEHPRCMKDCPPDAIHRSPSGEVFIDDSCIGCGSCRNSCPYGVIQMAEKGDYRRPGLLQLIFPRREKSPSGDVQVAVQSAKRAVKCDMCRGIIGGAACVRACPTGAAFRVGPEQFLSMSGRLGG